MAANTTPIFALKPHTPSVQITAVTTDKTGATTTNLKTLVTATTDGTKVTQIGYKIQGTSAAGLFLIFITDTAGANPYLYDEIAIAAVTSSTTVATARVFNSYSDLQLKSGQLILVGFTVISGSVNCTGWASIGDFS